MIAESHPIIRKILSDRKNAAMLASIGTAALALNVVLFEGTLWFIAIPVAFILMIALDIWLIRQRVRRGVYGDNRMEATEVAKAFTELNNSSTRGGSCGEP